MTFAELKSALEKLTPEQLAKEVICMSENNTVVVRELYTFPELHINLGEGFEPLSAYANDPNYISYQQLKDEAFDVLEKDTPILSVE